jgi:hypothetical protein
MGQEGNLVSKSKKMMIPLQKAMVESHCQILSQMMSVSVDTDIFVVALALVQLSGELIAKMEEQGRVEEVEALKYDWVNIVTNPIYDEIVNLDELPKEVKGRWKLEDRNRKK